MRNRKGQTILEYTIIFIIILGVLIAMKDYIKRGIQGRWRSAADDFGDQYDPRFVNSIINQSSQANTISTITVVNQTGPGGVPGLVTNRVDTSSSSETKTGYTQVGD